MPSMPSLYSTYYTNFSFGSKGPAGVPATASTMFCICAYYAWHQVYVPKHQFLPVPEAALGIPFAACSGGAGDVYVGLVRTTLHTAGVEVSTTAVCV